MHTVTISPTFQVVIPPAIRRELHLHPGMKLRAIRHHDRIELIPLKTLKPMRGLLRGMDTSIERDDDRL